MTYDELKIIAQPHIRSTCELPSNSFLLLTQLHIPFKTQKQCEDDYDGKMTPLYNHPAFLAEYHGVKTLYFNSNAQYWNFYIFHEIAHYILGHENDSPQNEIDADMLACILAAPIENLPTYLKSARDLSSLCKIPIDKAEMYWQEIKDKFSKWYKNAWVIGCMAGTLILSTTLFLCFNSSSPTENNIEENNVITTPAPDIKMDTYNQDISFYITPSGTHYHINDCKHIKYKNNTMPIPKEEVIKLNLEPCKDCI